MVVVTRLVYPLQAFSSQKLETLFSILGEETDFTYKRVSSPSPVLYGDEIYIEGEIPLQVAQEIARQIENPIAIRFDLPKRIQELLVKLHYYSCFYLDSPFIIFIGTALVNINDVLRVTGISTKRELFQTLFQTDYVQTLKSVLAVKPKGLIYSRRTFIEFVLPYHSPEFLMTWINEVLKHEISQSILTNVMEPERVRGKGFYTELKRNWGKIKPFPLEKMHLQGEMDLGVALKRALLYSGFKM